MDPDTPTPQLIQQPQKLIVESVSTQTSDRSLNAGSELQKKTSEDWLSGFDDRDGERIDLDEETDEVDSDKVMKRRREFEEKKSCKRGNDHEQASSETRVSIESDAPPNPAPPPSTTPETSSTTPSTVTSSTSDPNAPTASDAASGTGTGTESSDTPASSAPPTSAASGPPAPKSNDKDSTGDKIYVKSEYCGAPGEKVTTISSSLLFFLFFFRNSEINFPMFATLQTFLVNNQNPRLQLHVHQFFRILLNQKLRVPMFQLVKHLQR